MPAPVLAEIGNPGTPPTSIRAGFETRSHLFKTTSVSASTKARVAGSRTGASRPGRADASFAVRAGGSWAARAGPSGPPPAVASRRSKTASFKSAAAAWARARRIPSASTAACPDAPASDSVVRRPAVSASVTG